MIVLGLIGCGVISDAYLTGAARSALVRMKTVADLRPAAAAAQATKYNIVSASIEDLLADPEIQIVINLTGPLAHAEVDREIRCSIDNCAETSAACARTVRPKAQTRPANEARTGFVFIDTDLLLVKVGSQLVSKRRRKRRNLVTTAGKSKGCATPPARLPVRSCLFLTKP